MRGNKIACQFTTQGVGMQCINAVTGCVHVYVHPSIPTLAFIHQPGGR